MRTDGLFACPKCGSRSRDLSNHTCSEVAQEIPEDVGEEDGLTPMQRWRRKPEVRKRLREYQREYRRRKHLRHLNMGLK